MPAKETKAIGPWADLTWAQFDSAIIILSLGLEEKHILETPNSKSQLCQV